MTPEESVEKFYKDTLLTMVSSTTSSTMFNDYLFEYLFSGSRKQRLTEIFQEFGSNPSIFDLLLNMFWYLANPVQLVDCVLNNLRWKRFVHAELLHYHATGRHIAMLVEPGVKYTFSINDHLARQKKVGRRKKVCDNIIENSIDDDSSDEYDGGNTGKRKRVCAIDDLDNVGLDKLFIRD